MKILIKGAGDLASGIAYELWEAGHQILMTEIETPLAIRRAVSFSRAVYEKEAQVEQAKGVLAHSLEEALEIMEQGNLAVIVDREAAIRKEYEPEVLVDGIMAKKNTGTTILDAPLVIGIGPGFTAGEDCHCVVETKRGVSLGNVIRKGSALPDTGIPGEIGGYTAERLVRAAASGKMESVVKIGEVVKKGKLLAVTGGAPVYARISGIVRGMLMEGVYVTEGMKIGDIDSREVAEYCYTISDKARCVGRSVLEIVQSC